MKLLYGILNGEHIAYHDQTEFLVQVGKGKSAYKTKYRFAGKLSMAVLHYNGINIGNGYKKRLLMNDKTLAKSKS